MHKKLVLTSSLLLVLFLLLGVAGSTTSIAAYEDVPAIKLRVAPPFRPALGETAAIPDHLTSPGYAAGHVGEYLVQFAGPIHEADKAQLQALGADLLGYIPDYAFKVRMTPAQAALAASQPTVIWVGLFHPAYKLSLDLTPGTLNVYRVVLENGTDFAAAEAAIAATGIQVLSRNERIVHVMPIGIEQLDEVAQILDVAWIEPYHLLEAQNEFAAGVIMNANAAYANGYDGSGQIVAVADTGFSDGTANGHPDVPAGRIVNIYDWPIINNPTLWILCGFPFGDGSIDVDSGHGTHVALSVLGDGDGAGIGKGTAPNAQLVMQSTEDYCPLLGLYVLAGLPDPLDGLFQEAYGAGARIHSDSWGSAAAGVYEATSQQADQFMRLNPDFLLVFAAANSGVDGNSDGYVDEDSMGAPATAKNVLTVGASENARPDDYPCDTGLGYTTCAADGGINVIATYGTNWPSEFPTPPISTDPAAGNAEQLAAFSSRGPTDDNRIKPDVVAPGTWILSGYSDMYQEGYGDPTNPDTGAYQYDGWGNPFDARYKYMGGTSMATPLSSGAAAVVRQFYADFHGLPSPSAALVKAALINTARDLLDENNDGVDDNDMPIPNNHEGWGLIDLGRATDESLARDFEDIASGGGLSTGGSHVYNYDTCGAPAFKATLVWTDYEGSVGSGPTLVNNLNLTVSGPGGTFLGNVFSGGWSQTGGSADTINNVENVYIQAPANGTWSVTINGANVPNGPQGYALVIDGICSGPIGGDIAGNVTLQGRSDHSGTVVEAWQGATMVGSATTDAAGDFLVVGLPAGTYDVRAEGPQHLDGERIGEIVTIGGTTTLPAVQLAGGDANEDDIIDILDLSLIGGQYGASGCPLPDPRADIGADCSVSILDLSVTGGNFTATSPVPWP